MDIKDQPAFPDPLRAGNSSIENQTPYKEATGLTKREYMATHLLVGYLASLNPGSIRQYVNMYAEEAVTAADALLKALSE
jgi:hypothetical protein